MKKFLVPSLIILVACAGDMSDLPTHRITVSSGQSLTSVARMLEDSGLVTSAGRFKMWARIRGEQTGIQAGVFDVPVGAPMEGVLQTLTRGRGAYERITIPEGQMLVEIAATVESTLGIPVDSFLAAARDSALLREFGIDASDAEGYLYPTTYHVPLTAPASEVVRQMLDQFQEEWRINWNQRGEDLGLTPFETVILASIIEGEVRVDSDRAIVSSVYHNRLDRGMRLQADPTVIYSLGERRRLFFRDYRFQHPYNTYLINGLPPGPIGSPSAASIEAALYPAETSFLYFVADTTGEHVFAETLRGHNQNVQRVQSARNR